LTPDAPEACAKAKPLSECPSPAALPIPRRVLRSIDGALDIGGLYNVHFEAGAESSPEPSQSTRFRIPPSAPDYFIILADQWWLAVAGADFETKPLLPAFARFFWSITFASAGNKKPDRSSLSIALRSREEYVSTSA